MEVNTLPEISRLLGKIVATYYNDHNPPHFHAKYGDFEAVIAIATGEIVEGRLPPRVLGLVQEWREYHKTELTEDWNLARDRKDLTRISHRIHEISLDPCFHKGFSSFGNTMSIPLSQKFLCENKSLRDIFALQ